MAVCQARGCTGDMYGTLSVNCSEKEKMGSMATTLRSRTSEWDLRPIAASQRGHRVEASF
jgi:hypothetical protein